MRETLAARDASDEELLRVHTPGYLELVKRETQGLRAARDLSTGDVVVDVGSLATARRAAGGALAAMEASVAGGESVFALVRPPGHHAEPARGMGFCLFNNVAVAARAFQANGGGRVLVVDIDYHHGNGTEAVAGKGLSYLSTHAYPAYPGTGLRSYRMGDDLVANVPLPAGGVTTETFVATWEALLSRVAEIARPDLLIVSAGFDYVRGDPIGDLGIGAEAARYVAAAVTATAATQCGGRVIWVLEGGYDLDVLTGSIEQIAAVSDGRIPGPSGADPAAMSKSAMELLAVISEIPQGGQAGTAN